MDRVGVHRMTNPLARYDYWDRCTMPTRKRMQETTMNTPEPQRRAITSQPIEARGYNQQRNEK